jgi:hypothetical protein
MLRSLLFAAVALAFLAGVNLSAADKKKTTTVNGEISKIDAEKGVLTLKVKVKKDLVEKDFKIDEKTPVAAYSGKVKTELTGKDVLKKEQFKVGSPVAITTDADGIITEVAFGKTAKKVTTAAGEISKVDAEKGVLTVKVKVKKDLVEKEFKIDEKTPVAAYDGAQKTDLTGKDVLKKDQFKVGSQVTVVTNDDNVTEVFFGSKKKK